MVAGEQAGFNGVSSYLKFSTTNIGSLIRTEKMRIAENGNVGIGDSDPENALSIKGNITGGERTMLVINNTDGSNLSSAALEVKASSKINYTTLRMHGDNYSYSWWAKHGQLKTLGDGLIIEATKSDGAGGDIIFVNGETGGSNVEKTVNMLIDGNGNIGVGTTTPSSKLHVAEGDIYIENATKGVIMTSPNGNCWRMTVGNDGNPTFSAIDCPQ